MVLAEGRDLRGPVLRVERRFPDPVVGTRLGNKVARRLLPPAYHANLAL